MFQAIQRYFYPDSPFFGHPPIVDEKMCSWKEKKRKIKFLFYLEKIQSAGWESVTSCNWGQWNLYWNWKPQYTSEAEVDNLHNSVKLRQPRRNIWDITFYTLYIFYQYWFPWDCFMIPVLPQIKRQVKPRS